jgi:chromosome segregation ATPase
MAKAPALSIQIRALRQELAEAQAAVAELETKLHNVNNTRDSYYKYWTEAKAELDDVQRILDALPGVLPRRAENDYSDLPVNIRFLSWVVSHFVHRGGTSND